MSGSRAFRRRARRGAAGAGDPRSAWLSALRSALDAGDFDSGDLTRDEVLAVAEALAGMAGPDGTIQLDEEDPR